MNNLNELIWTYFFLPSVLVFGLILTLRCGALQFTRFKHAMKSTIGSAFKKSEADSGTVTPLQAASTALASTVGTGNIVGTAQAIAMGGPGAVFWMWLVALLGMIIKYAEIYLGLRYRVRNKDGKYLGGPMYYIERGLGRRFIPMATAYAVFAILSVLSMGNMSQINGTVSAIVEAGIAFGIVSVDNQFKLRLVLGAVLAAVIAIILAGDAKRVGKVTELLVPLMSIVFILLTSIVLICHAERLLPSLARIVTEAFKPSAALGAAGGISVKEAIGWGVRRGAFTNEAGLGTAAIAHASASTDNALEHSLWGVFEVFADTIVICSATALAILCSPIDIPWGSAPGPELLQAAFATVFGARASSLFMALSLSLFGLSSVIGCSIYGLRCVEYAFGEKWRPVYQTAFAVCTVCGSVMSTVLVWTVADTANAFMSIPNLIALFLLSGQVVRESRSHFFGDNRTALRKMRKRLD